MSIEHNETPWLMQRQAAIKRFLFCSIEGRGGKGKGERRGEREQEWKGEG